MLSRILIFFSLFLVGCGSYQLSTTPKLKITKVLTITSTGDTLAVPIKEFQKYNYDNIRFNTWNNSPFWHSWNNPYFGWGNYGWNFGYYNNPRFWNFSDWYYRPPTWNLSTPIRPQVQSPRVRRVEVKGRRGSVNNNWNNKIIPRKNNNFTPSRSSNNPPVINRSSSNVNPVIRANVGRGSSGGRRNNQ